MKSLNPKNPVQDKETMSEWKETEIGMVSSGYDKFRIEDIAIKMADAPFGTSIKNEDYVDEGVVVVQGNNIKGKKFDWSSLRFVTVDKFLSLPRSHCTIGDLIFPKVGTIGKVGMLSSYKNDTKYLLSTNTMMLRVNPKKANHEYVYYYFSSKKVKDYIEMVNPNSVQPVFNFTSLKNFPVYLPSLPEQTAIAEVLSSLDDKIDLLHRQNKTLEQLAETLFRQWFVEEAEENWEVDILGNLFDIKIGRTPPRKEQHWFSTNSKDIKWISIKDLGNSGIYIDTVSEYLTNEAVERFSIPIIPVNTVLLSFKLTVGRVAITTEEMLSNEAIAHFKIKPNSNLFPEYLYLFLKVFNFNSLGSTSSIAEAINSQMIKEIEMQIPDEKKLELFKVEVEPLFQKIKSNTQQIRTLTQLRDSLLPKLMSGEVSFSNIS